METTSGAASISTPAVSAAQDLGLSPILRLRELRRRHWSHEGEFLTCEVKRRVRERFGVTLEEEVLLVGDWTGQEEQDEREGTA